jgi:hypothetical protein
MSHYSEAGEQRSVLFTGNQAVKIQMGCRGCELAFVREESGQRRWSPARRDRDSIKAGFTHFPSEL